MRLTRRYAAGLAFVVIGCCGNGAWWASLLFLGIGLYLMFTDPPEVSP